MTRVTQISKEEIEPIVAARAKVMESAGVAEKALKDARLAELEFKVQIQQLYLAKGLDANCRVDISNGNVAWPDDVVPALPAIAEPGVEEPKKRRVKKAVEAKVEEKIETEVE